MAPLCDDPALQAALADLSGWPQQIACGYSANVGNAAGDHRVGMTWDAWAMASTMGVGSQYVAWFDGSVAQPDQVVGTFELETGSNLLVNDCNDALDPSNMPSVAATWNAIAGTATLTVAAINPPSDTFTGEVSLSSIVVELSTSPGTTCTLPDAAWTNLFMGWLPG